MSDVLASFGVKVEDICDDTGAYSYPDVVPGRVAHIDADFMAYQAASDTSEEKQGIRPLKTLEQKFERAENGLNHLRRIVGAETGIAHITPSGSNKGGREHQAVTLPYQGNRAMREDRPEHLDALRHYIAENTPCIVHLDQEADDGMAQANYAACANGTRHLSVIVSKDKDLRMVPGLHWDFDNELLHDVSDPFGSIWIDDSKSTKKLSGWGTKFFWAQCLMGDAADNIKGLPAITGYVANEVIGPMTKAYEKAKTRYKLNPKNEHAGLALDMLMHKQKPCGAMTAFQLLENMQNDAQCYKLVRALFMQLTPPNFEWVHHATQEPCTPTQALFGDMQTLWMRRTKDPLDVLHWLKEVTK